MKTKYGSDALFGAIKDTSHVMRARSVASFKELTFGDMSRHDAPVLIRSILYMR